MSTLFWDHLEGVDSRMVVREGFPGKGIPELNFEKSNQPRKEP